MTPKHILIIEDDLEFQRLLQHIVAQGGYETLVASNGAGGLKVLEERAPDMILLDIRLPDTDGYEVCRAIRSNPKHSRVPIIMVTIESQVKEIVRGLKLGADDYVVKPFDPQELLARVRALFRQARVSGEKKEG